MKPKQTRPTFDLGLTRLCCQW